MYWCFEPTRLQSALEEFKVELRRNGMQSEEADLVAKHAQDFLHSKTAHDHRLVISPGEKRLNKLADLLNRTANALKGEAEGKLHSWHDLPEVAAELKVRADKLSAPVLESHPEFW